MVTITDKEFRKLADYIKNNYGIFLREEKKALLTGRLYSILMNQKCSSFTEYFNYLIHDKTGEAITTLINRITTNHTFFMREADHFYYFRDHVLPFWFDSIRDKDLRTWCAACSTGEESYTLAMFIDEFFTGRAPGWDTTLLATDISHEVLQTAQKGVYSQERIDPLPADWKRKYFRPYDVNNYVVDERIRKKVIYRNFNLVERVYPFRRKFHVIFCRNVMIYFDAETKNELVNKFYEHMEYGGYLFIGHSESLSRETTKFKYIKPAVYRKV